MSDDNTMSDDKNKKIDINSFLSVGIQVAEMSGLIIREVYESGILEQKDKSEGDPVTIADLRAQKTIETCLKHHFPNLHLQGEESKQSLEGVVIKADPTQINKSFLKEDLLNKSLLTRQEFNKNMKNEYQHEIWSQFEYFNTSNSVVYIDPLDGTKDFVNGNLCAVTVLIGLAIDGVPKAAIVHNPFKSNENNEKYGYTLFGTQEHGVFKLDYRSDYSLDVLNARIPEYIPPFDISKVYDAEYEIKFAASLQRFDDLTQATVDKFKPVQLCKLGGAGNKIAKVVLQEIDAYVNPRGVLSFWDMCGPEVLIRAMGGKVTNIDGQRLDYSYENYKKSSKIPPFLIGKTIKLHDHMIQRRKNSKE